MKCPSRSLAILRACDIDEEPPDERWLIRGLWSRGAVGFLAGPPKLGKTFLGIDMAVSVTSGTPCLGHFAVEHPGPALIYLAEDALPLVRSRIESLCEHRRLEIHDLPLHVIAEPCLRLDQEADQDRLAAAVERLRPHLLLLDPLIRLHRLDENNAMEISGLLSFFRELQRRFDCAVAIVHHVSKKRYAQLGQSMRGSSDLHAFADSSGYLIRRQQKLILTVEHRAARAPEPMVLELLSGPKGTDLHLERKEGGQAAAYAGSLAESVLRVLREAGTPVAGKELRRILRVNNQKLWETLRSLEERGVLQQTQTGWQPSASESDADQGLLFG